MSNQKTWRELAEDLARDLQQAGGWMVWVNMPLGSVQLRSPGIADVVAVSKSYNTTVRIYEVKTSSSDFWGDVNRGKFLRYQGTCNQLYFAAEAGVLKKENIPEGCGLITLSEKGWHVQIAAKRMECKLTEEFLIALLMRGYQDFWQKMRPFNTEAGYYEYKGLADAAAKFGKKYARDLAQGQEYLREASELRQKIDEALGLPHGSLDSAVWNLRGEIDRLLVQYKYAEEIALLSDILRRLFQGGTYNVVPELRVIAEKLEKRLPG